MLVYIKDKYSEDKYSLPFEVNLNEDSFLDLLNELISLVKCRLPKDLETIEVCASYNSMIFDNSFTLFYAKKSLRLTFAVGMVASLF